jgi:hypothetical protein
MSVSVCIEGGLKDIGTVYSTNITPDSSGICQYSFEDFDQAVRHGVGKSGSTLYPGKPSIRPPVLGAWYWNRYPCALSDSTSFVYCFSWDRELCQEWNITTRQHPGY